MDNHDRRQRRRQRERAERRARQAAYDHDRQRRRTARQLLDSFRDSCEPEFTIGGDRWSRAAQRLFALYCIPFHVNPDADVVVDLSQLPESQREVLAHLVAGIMSEN